MFPFISLFGVLIYFQKLSDEVLKIFLRGLILHHKVSVQQIRYLFGDTSRKSEERGQCVMCLDFGEGCDLSTLCLPRECSSVMWQGAQEAG